MESDSDSDLKFIEEEEGVEARALRRACMSARVETPGEALDGVEEGEDEEEVRWTRRGGGAAVESDSLTRVQAAFRPFRWLRTIKRGIAIATLVPMN